MSLVTPASARAVLALLRAARFPSTVPLKVFQVLGLIITCSR